MPLAPVDDSGTQLYYVDSGAPSESNKEYATLVLIHGAIFHSEVFKALFPWAPLHNVRLVALNMRDYPGSTPYTDAELADMRSPDKDRQRMQLHRRGLEIAAFLVWFIRREKIPPYVHNLDKTSGGVSLLGWSWGNTMSLCFIARAKQLLREDRELLEAYLRTLVIYDPSPHSAIGTQSYFDHVYNPICDSTLTREQQVTEFPLWVSGYYAHAPRLLASFADLSYEEVEASLSKKRVFNPPPFQVPTLQRMSADEVEAMTAKHVWARSQYIYQPDITDMTLFRENTRAALQDASVWPRMRVRLVWAPMTVGEVALTAWDIASHAKVAQTNEGRPIQVVRSESGNHFTHVDFPEETMCLLADNI